MEADKNSKYDENQNDEEKKDKSTVLESASSAVPLKETEHVSDEEEDISWSSDDSDSDEEYICTLCSKTFSGVIPLKQHEKSGSHLRKKMKKKLEKKLEKEIVKLEKLEDNEEENLDFIKEPFAACKTCKKSFGDPLSYHKHLISKKHKRKAFEAKLLHQVKSNGNIDSEALKKMFHKKADPTKEGKDNTQASGAYEDILNDLKIKLSVSKAESKSSESDSSDDAEEFNCTVCDKYFGSLVTYFQHMTSKSHKKKLKQNKMLEQLTKSEKESEVVVDISSIDTEDDILMCKPCSVAFSGPESAFAHLKSKGHKKKLEVLKWKRSHRQKREVRSKSFTSCEEHRQDLANTESVNNEMNEISAADANNKDLDSKPSLKSGVKHLPSSSSHELGKDPKDTIISATNDSQQKPNIIEALLQKEAKQNIKEAQEKGARGNIVEEESDIKQKITEEAHGKESENKVPEEAVEEEVKEGKIAPQKYKVYKQFMSSFRPNANK
ncbi:zinc finger protein 346-like [Stegodyphus dumicola]|uniref:zinc finger protein 346-like n=1 Tax=Stegodyphus dumicola TaxID=202533 RepID=UPI0015B0C210|nr:zinc finger protein 346-like [Stegodyphus dumicola]